MTMRFITTLAALLLLVSNHGAESIKKDVNPLAVSERQQLVEKLAAAEQDFRHTGLRRGKQDQNERHLPNEYLISEKEIGVRLLGETQTGPRGLGRKANRNRKRARIRRRKRRRRRQRRKKLQDKKTMNSTVPSLENCTDGSVPLADVFCGRGPSRQDCPEGYYCLIDPTDRFAFCCAIEAIESPIITTCPDGSDPLHNVSCGWHSSGDSCPEGYYCWSNSPEHYAICCADVTPIEEIEPSLANCTDGSDPLAGIFCGRGPNHQDCPPGYYCLIDPADRFAICCFNGTIETIEIESPIITTCPDGSDPLHNVSCGWDFSGDSCPEGYYCWSNSPEHYAICCADEASETPTEEIEPSLASCTDGSDPLAGIFCGRGPDRQDCPEGYYCLIDPADRFAFCCANDIIEATEIESPIITTCPDGSDPLQDVSCGWGPNDDSCPVGHYCWSSSVEHYSICCAAKCRDGSDPLQSCAWSFCPEGYYCLSHPADHYAICCSEDSKGKEIYPPVNPTLAQCIDGSSPLADVFCGRGPNRQDCPEGYSCLIDPADRFAICCHD